MQQLIGGLITLGIIFIIFSMIGKDTDHSLKFLKDYAPQSNFNPNYYK